jgi:uncharacterized peroxidase-related enzyme
MSAWIKIIQPEDADGQLRDVYREVQSPHGTVDNVMKELALLNYAASLTLQVASIEQTEIRALQEQGCSDTEILEVNQVVAYFNYSNRVLNGLGVTTEGDVVGYYA